MLHEIDAIRINFDEGQLGLLNLCLMFLMFGVALDIRPREFVRLFREPRAPVVGLLSEYLLLPLICLSLIYLLKPAPSLALGMVLLSACPGGSTSNYMVHLSGSNSALSITLTSITTLAAVVVTPLAFAVFCRWIPGAETLQANIAVEPGRMIRTIFQLLFIPVALGMFIAHRYPRVKARIEPPVRVLSLLIFLGFVAFAVAGNWEHIRNHLHLVFLLVFLHNGLALLGGYWFARAAALPEADARAISIETGIQNSGLGLIIVFNFFPQLGGMALIVAWWGVWHLLSGFAMALWWRRSSAPPEPPTSHPHGGAGKG